MTEGQLWTAVSAGLLTSGQMTRALQQFGLEAKTPKDLQALLLKQALEGSMSVAAAAADEAVAAAAADEAARVKAQAAADETARVQAQAATAEAAAAVAQAQEIHLASLRAAAAAAAAELAAAEAAASAPAPPTSPMPTHARPGQGSPQSVVEVVPVEEGIDAVLSPFGGSTTVPRAIQGTAPTDPLPDAYRRGVLRQLDLNFLRSLAKKPDLAVAESALRIAKQDRAMLGGLPTSVLRRVVSFVTSQGFGDMPEEFLFTPAWTAAASQRAAESAAVVAHLAAGLPPKHPLAHLLEACGSKVTDRGCASSVVHLLESLVDLTPVVDSVEAALLKEEELKVLRINWEDLELNRGFLAVTITSFITQFDEMLAALAKVGRGTSLDIVQQLVHFLTAGVSPGPEGSRQSKVYNLLIRLETDYELGAFRDLHQLRVFIKKISDRADAGLDPSAAAAPRPSPAKPAPGVRAAAPAGSAPRAAAAVALAQTKARPSYYFMSPAVHALAKHLRHCFRCGGTDHMLDSCTAKERGCALCGEPHKADDCPQPPAAKNE
jgi:hypothetical protein